MGMYDMPTGIRTSNKHPFIGIMLTPSLAQYLCTYTYKHTYVCGQRVRVMYTHIKIFMRTSNIHPSVHIPKETDNQTHMHACTCLQACMHARVNAHIHTGNPSKATRCNTLQHLCCLSIVRVYIKPCSIHVDVYPQSWSLCRFSVPGHKSIYISIYIHISC